MGHSPKRITELLLVACCVLAGCRGNDGEREDTVPSAVAAAPDSVFAPSDERVHLPGDRIYYTLTTHDWYARGEPLLHEGRAYRPGGMPIAASLPEMSRLGEFRGVEYYGKQGDNVAAVYVPVFEGYWQLFRTTAEVIDTTLWAPPPPDPDTVSHR